MTFNGAAPTSKLLEDLSYHVGEHTYPGTSNVLDHIPEGEVTLIASHPDYLDTSQTFQLLDNTLLRVPLDMKPKPGVVNLEIEPAGLALTLTANSKTFRLKDARRFTLTAGEDYKLPSKPPTTSHSS